MNLDKLDQVSQDGFKYGYHRRQTNLNIVVEKPTVNNKKSILSELLRLVKYSKLNS